MTLRFQMVPERVMIGMGSNIGDRYSNLESAVRAISLVNGVDPIAVAGVYQSAALVLPGAGSQPDFLNTVLDVNVRLTAGELLNALLDIETRLGRERTVSRWQPRSIDLDILLFGDLVCDTQDLQIPHPSMVDRAFVMIPLAELAPDRVIPGQTQTAGQLAARFSPDDLHFVGSINLTSLSHVAG
jgi:2-amino-4-hydroxy-6-hydroxymethyldihydropteridine diphosphokinase